MRTRSSVPCGHSCSARRRWAVTAVETASFARRKATKNESPCVSISWPSFSGKRLAEDPLMIGERLPVDVSSELLEQLGRAFDVGEQEGDGADRQLADCAHPASLSPPGGRNQARAGLVCGAAAAGVT